jgi:hypothetical protein
MTTRSNGSCSVTSTDVLIAMLSSDLRGSWAETGGPRRGRRPDELAVDPAASASLPVMVEPDEPEPEAPEPEAPGPAHEPAQTRP